MAEIARPNYLTNPVITQRYATAAVLIDPATGSPYNGNTGTITTVVDSVLHVEETGEEVIVNSQASGEEGN